MRNAIVLTVVLALLLGCTFAHARNTEISMELMGGYTFLTMNIGESEVYMLDKQWKLIEPDDDSTFETGPMAGFALTFSPGKGLVRFVYGLEAFWSMTSGELNVKYDTPEGGRDYKNDFDIMWGQVDAMVGAMFAVGDFRPYARLGIGPTLSRIDFGGNTQEHFAVAITAAAGGDYRITKWFSAGLQLRYHDLLELGYDQWIDKTYRVNFEPRPLPLTGLVKIGFHF